MAIGTAPRDRREPRVRLPILTPSKSPAPGGWHRLAVAAGLLLALAGAVLLQVRPMDSPRAVTNFALEVCLLVCFVRVCRGWRTPRPVVAACLLVGGMRLAL